MLHPIAPTPEGQQCLAAFGVLQHRVAEWNYRTSNLYRISDAAVREREETYLAQVRTDIAAEHQRLAAWRYDIHRRQVATGVLVAHENGTFTLRQGFDVRTGGAGQTAANVAATSAKMFAGTQFRTKFGIVGVALMFLALLMIMAGLHDLGALLGFGGGTALFIWLILGALSGGIALPARRPAQGGGYESQAQAAQIAAMRAQAERDAETERAEAEAKAAAEARRRDAIRRAAERAQANTDEWG